jgi:hypothetical protein
MADSLDLSEIVRRTIQANARFYKGWVDLSLEYFRGITEIFGGSVPAPTQTETPDADAGAGVLVMEGEEGAAVGSAFLVTNDVGRPIPCDIIASEFTDPSGAKVHVKAAFDPQKFELAPGDQRVVKAQITIDGKLTPGTAYNGEFGIRGLTGFAVPVVLRRQHTIEDSLPEPASPGVSGTTGTVRPAPTPRQQKRPSGKARRADRSARQKQ